jgi:hypothetical protein
MVGIKAHDIKRPKWESGDTIKLTYDRKAHTLSYWHKGALKTTFEGRMKFMHHQDLKEDARMCIWFYANSSLARFEVTASGHY